MQSRILPVDHQRVNNIFHSPLMCVVRDNVTKVPPLPKVQSSVVQQQQQPGGLPQYTSFHHRGMLGVRSHALDTMSNIFYVRRGEALTGIKWAGDSHQATSHEPCVSPGEMLVQRPNSSNTAHLDQL